MNEKKTIKTSKGELQNSLNMIHKNKDLLSEHCSTIIRSTNTI